VYGTSASADDTPGNHATWQIDGRAEHAKEHVAGYLEQNVTNEGQRQNDVVLHADKSDIFFETLDTSLRKRIAILDSSSEVGPS